MKKKTKESLKELGKVGEAFFLIVYSMVCIVMAASGGFLAYKGGLYLQIPHYVSFVIATFIVLLILQGFTYGDNQLSKELKK